MDRRRFAICIVGGLLVLTMTGCFSASGNQEGTMEESKLKVEETVQKATAEQLMDIPAGPMEIVSVYRGNEDATGLIQAMDSVNELSAQALVDKLIEYKVLDEGTVVLNFTVTEEIGYLDLSSVPVSGSSGEVLILTSIGNTFTENFELEKLKLLVNGENYSSGHIEHEDQDYLRFNKRYKKLM